MLPPVDGALEKKKHKGNQQELPVVPLCVVPPNAPLARENMQSACYVLFKGETVLVSGTFNHLRGMGGSCGGGVGGMGM